MQRALLVRLEQKTLGRGTLGYQFNTRKYFSSSPISYSPNIHREVSYREFPDVIKVPSFVLKACIFHSIKINLMAKFLAFNWWFFKKSIVTAILSAFALHVLTRNTSSYIFPYPTLSIGEAQIHTMFIHLGPKTSKLLKQIYLPSVKQFSHLRNTGTFRKPWLHFKIRQIMKSH